MKNNNLVFLNITKQAIGAFSLLALLCVSVSANENNKELIVDAIKYNKIYAIFNTQAIRKSTMGFEVGGIVKKKYLDVSDKVKKGDKLFELVNNDAKSRVEVAIAQYELAKKDYTRAKKIKNVINKAQFNKYKYTYMQNKANLALSRANLEKTIIRAPYDGVITDTFYDDGDIVPAFSKVLKIQQNSKTKLILEFDEKYYSDIKVGDKFVYKVDGYKANNNSSSPIKGYSNVGYISKVYPSVDTNTRKIKAEVITTGIADGLFGDGYIITNSKEQ